MALPLLARIWGKCSTINFLPALSFCFKVEISLCTLIPLFRPVSVHSGSASSDDCGWVFPDELLVSSFLHGFPHYAWIAAAHSDFVVSRVYACVGVTCHLQFWEIDRGILRATAVTRGWNGHRIKVSTQSWPWWRTLSCHFCPDSNSEPTDHESGAVTNKLSRLITSSPNHFCISHSWTDLFLFSLHDSCSATSSSLDG